jgi:hypothetical protein
LSKVVTKYTPGSNLSRYSTYRILSHNETGYKLKVYQLTYTIQYEVDLGDNVDDKFKVTLETSNIPLIVKDKNGSRPVKSLSVKCNLSSHSLIYEKSVVGKLSYSKICSDSSNLYVYFNDSLYIIPILKPEKAESKKIDFVVNDIEVKSVRLVSQFEPDIVNKLTQKK